MSWVVSVHVLPCACFAHLFEDDGLSVELVCGVGSLLYLGWDGEAEGRQLPDLPEQRHQSVRVLDLQPTVHVVQVHHPVTGLQTGEGGEGGGGWWQGVVQSLSSHCCQSALEPVDTYRGDIR